MDTTGVIAVMTVYMIIWIYETIAWFKPVLRGNDVLFSIIFTIINLILASTVRIFSTTPILLTTSYVCTSNSTAISANITTTSSICSYHYTAAPIPSVFLLPFYLFLMYAIIGGLLVIYALVKIMNRKIKGIMR